MENNENKNANNKPKGATSDLNGEYMQISTSGRGLHPTPRRTVQSAEGARANANGKEKRPAQGETKKRPAKNANARRAVQRRPDVKKTPAKGVEYSFTNSGLFNNSEVVQNAAIQEKNMRLAEERRKAQEAMRENGEKTRVIQTRGINAAAQGAKKTPTPAQTRVIDTVKTDKNGRRMPRQSAGHTYRGANMPPRRPRADASSPVPASQNTKTVDAIKTSKRKNRIKYPPRPDENKYGAMNSISRAFIYIAGVLVCSIILSVIVITNANDIFAFVKNSEQISITIEEGTDLNALAKQLKSLGVINHKETFKAYIRYRKKDSDYYTPGTYTVSPSLNYDQIISAITPVAQRESVSVTIPEGFTVDDIIELFLTKFPDTTREHFVDVIQNYDFDSYWFVKEIPKNSDKIYRLEGYLFPDTYYFYTDMTEETIISKLLDNFEKKYTDTYRTRATELGYTTDQVVTLASIIQAEGKERIVTVTDDEDNPTTYVDYGLISSVFSNRMGIGMKLQSDATTAYAVNMSLAHGGSNGSYNLKTYTKPGEYKLSDYTNADYANPYNTYYIAAFPPGGVCNPGLNAVSFALWPDRSQYLYFVSDSSGKTYFTKNLEDHRAVVETLK